MLYITIWSPSLTPYGATEAHKTTTSRTNSGGEQSDQDMERADRIKANVDVPTVLGWYGVKWIGHGNIRCPLGTHRDTTPSFSIYDNNTAFKCFGCGEAGDAISLVRILGHFASSGEAMNYIESKIGSGKRAGNSDHRRRKDRIMGEAQITETAPDVSKMKEYIEQCRKAYEGSKGAEYMERRGISGELAVCRGIGFDPQFVYYSKVNGQKMTGEFVIIPYGRGSGYLARAIDPRIDKADSKRYPTGFHPTEYPYPDGWEALLTDSDESVFVVESITDALSFEEVGIGMAKSITGVRGPKAIALGGTSGVGKFLEKLETMKKSEMEKEITAPLILIPDNDDAGLKNWDKLAEGLRRIGIDYCYYRDSRAPDIFNVLKDMGVKDANEAIVKDRQTFERNIYAAETAASAEIERKRMEEFAGSATSMEDFEAELERYKGDIPTGYKQLDNILDGGLSEGLYIVAATTGFGKTAFCLQMAEDISGAGENGADVLFYTLELSKTEMIARGIARTSFLNKFAFQDGEEHSVTVSEVLKSKRRDIKAAQYKALQEAKKDYSKTASRLKFVEGDGSVTAETIRHDIKEHRKKHGEDRRLVIFIDYLQIMAPIDNGRRYTDKQVMDDTTSELRRIARDLNVPIVGISSLNREGYSGKIELKHLKESGSIEYAASCVIGIEAQGLFAVSATAQTQTQEEKFNKSKHKTARRMDGIAAELVILKNRRGGSTFIRKEEDESGDYTENEIVENIIGLNFYGAYSYYNEINFDVNANYRKVDKSQEKERKG